MTALRFTAYATARLLGETCNALARRIGKPGLRS